MDPDEIVAPEFKTFPGSIKDVDLGENEVLAYWAAFGNEDADGDVIEPGTFEESIDRRGPDGTNRIKVLFHHDPWTPIGKPLTLEEDDHGLKARYKVAETRAGKDALTLMDEGVVTEHSVGMSDIVRDDEQRRHIVQATLWEGSPVTWGANPLTPVLDMGKAGAPVDRFIKELDRRLEKTKRALRGPVTEETAENLILQVQAIEKIVQPLRNARQTEKDADPLADDPVNERAKDAIQSAADTIDRLHGAVTRDGKDPVKTLQSVTDSLNLDL